MGDKPIGIPRSKADGPIQAMIAEMDKQKGIAYHRISDDSVSSMTFPLRDIPRVIAEWQANSDIDEIWTRDNNGIVDWLWSRIDEELWFGTPDNPIL